MAAHRADINAPFFRSLRPALAACLILLLLGSLVAASPASAEQAASTGGSGFVQQALTAPNGVFAGRASVVNGHIDNFSGLVSISARRGSTSDYLPIGSARADADGDFTLNWKAPKSGLYSFRIAPVSTEARAANAGAQASLAVYKRQKATWYGPGFYGSRTACGQKLTRRTLGVAHKTLPCGTQVEFFLRGKRITVPVIDRGPFANAAHWDLTLAAMRQLGSSSTEVLGALPLR